MNDSIKEISEEELYDSDFERDDPTVVLMQICNVFQVSGRVLFSVSGFGQKSWFVDCGMDLLTIIEQVPEILGKISNGIFTFPLDFYEQGVERLIVFAEVNNMVKVTCTSRTNWMPNPNTIFMEKAEVQTIFESLYNHFLVFSKILCPDLANDPLLGDWKYRGR